MLTTSRNNCVTQRNKATDTQPTAWRASTDNKSHTKRHSKSTHTQYRKTLLTPARTQCPVPTEQLEDYRRTTIRFKDGITTRLKTNVKQWMFQTEHSNRCEKEKQFSGSEKEQQQQLTTKTQPKSAPQKGLLAQREPILEESTHRATQSILHTGADT